MCVCVDIFESMKRTADEHISVADDVVAEQEQQPAKMAKTSQTTSEEKHITEFEVMQAYRQLQGDITKGRVRALRGGDIDITTDTLETVDKLYEFIKQKKNNNLFAEDSRAIAGISELAEITVRNLKLGEMKGLTNIDDIMAYCKRYMLQEHFKQNNIVETKNNFEATNHDTDADEDDENEDERPNDDDDYESFNNKKVDELKKSTLKKDFLNQFQNYDSFHQFNWFKMGSLFNGLSKLPLVTDNLIGPFAIEKKVKVKVIRKRNIDVVGELVKPDNPSAKDLVDNDEQTTPEQVKRCFKILSKKLGNDDKISLFKFVLDPNSFPKSVENLFYTSFLIKAGRIVMEEDENDGYPTIRIKNKPKGKDKEERNIQKHKNSHAEEHHIIFQMDMPTWSKLIKKFNITSSYLET